MSQQKYVLYISGPRDLRRGNGQYAGKTDISRVRLKKALQIACQGGFSLIASLKKSDLPFFKRDLKVLRRDRRLRLPDERIIYRTGVKHTLDNAWDALRFAHEQSAENEIVIIPVTNEWHMPRVMGVFTTLEAGIGEHLGRRIGLEFVTAPYSRRRRVRRFEQYSLLPREQKIASILHARQYVAALCDYPRNGFPPWPDELCEFDLPDVPLLSRLEPESELRPGL